jgi:hypothetical protein
MAWLTSQSIWVLLAGCLGITLLVALGGYWAARAYVPQRDRDAACAIAAALMTAFAAAFAILAGLSLSNEAGYLTSAQNIVSNEAADASRLAWAATNPGVDSASVQSALSAYLHATRTYEWQGDSATNGDNPATDRAHANLEHLVRVEASLPSVGAPASNELLSALDAVSIDRRARLAAAARNLPGLYVITLFVMGVALILDACLLAMRSRLRGAISVASLAIVVGLSMALLFALGGAWSGTIVVSGQPIDRVIHDLRTGYFGTSQSEPASAATNYHS